MTAQIRKLFQLLQADRSSLLGRIVGRARARLLLRGLDVGPGVVVLGALQPAVKGHLRVGPRVTFLRGVIPTHLVVHAQGSLEIGEGTLLNYGCSIEASRHVRLGSRCMLASLIRIADTDERRTAPVVIGDDVWIAHGAFIGPGVTIGNGAIVAAGSVVLDDVPAETMAVGNPARVMALPPARHAG